MFGLEELEELLLIFEHVVEDLLGDHTRMLHDLEVEDVRHTGDHNIHRLQDIAFGLIQDCRRGDIDDIIQAGEGCILVWQDMIVFTLETVDLDVLRVADHDDL